MIIVPRLELAIITPSRTASRSVHLAVCGDHRINAIWVEGPIGWDVVSHDHRHVPLCFRDFKVAMVIRHPLDRLVSLWRHIAECDPPLPDRDQTLRQYVKRILTCDKSYYGPFRWTLHEWCEWYHLSQVVRYESMESDLCELLKVNNLRLGVIGETQRHRDWRSYYDEESLFLAQTWARQDLERWYPTDSMLITQSAN